MFPINLLLVHIEAVYYCLYLYELEFSEFDIQIIVKQTSIKNEKKNLQVQIEELKYKKVGLRGHLQIK